MGVQFSGNATANLKSIALYIARDNVRRAKQFSKDLRLECKKLGDHSARFVRVPGYESVRKRAYGSYIIYYRVTSEAVDILHIFHGAMNVEEINFNLPDNEAL